MQHIWFIFNSCTWEYWQDRIGIYVSDICSLIKSDICSLIKGNTFKSERYVHL